MTSEFVLAGKLPRSIVWVKSRYSPRILNLAYHKERCPLNRLDRCTIAIQPGIVHVDKRYVGPSQTHGDVVDNGAIILRLDSSVDLIEETLNVFGC